MKSLNYFTRPQGDILKPSCSGAIISLLTILAATFLISYELLHRDLKTVERRVVIPRSSQDSHNEIDVNIDIILPHAPCASLRVQKEDATNFQSTTIRTGLAFERTAPEDPEIIAENYIDPEIAVQYANEEEQVQTIITGLRNDEQCRIRGTFSVQRLPGSFAISHELAYSYLARIRQIDSELYSKLSLGHVIVSLTLGNYNSTELDLGNEDSGADGMDYLHWHPLSCFYYLEIIARTFDSTDLQYLYGDVFQYSFHRKCYVLDETLTLRMTMMK